MKTKTKVIILAVCVFGVLLLIRGPEAFEMAKQGAIDQMEWTKEHNAGGENYNEELADEVLEMLKGEEATESRKIYGVGETVTFESGISVTITEWGTKYNHYHGQTISYIDVEFENNGTEACSISPGMLSVYADDYAMDITYMEDDASNTVAIDVGRRAGLRIYAVVDPRQVEKLEAQLGNAVWVLKEYWDGVNIDITDWNIKIPQSMMAGSELLENISGYYEGVQEDTALSISMFSSPEGNVLGNAEIYVNGIKFEGKLVEVATNIYVFIYDADDVVLLGFYCEDTELGTCIKAQIYSDGEKIDECVMVEEYIS